MHFILIAKATTQSETGVLPTPELIAELKKFNQEMKDAQVLVETAGLKASFEGARVHISGTQRAVVHGPFAETNELIAGFWIVNVASLDEAIEWVKRCPNPHGGLDCQIEIRPFLDPEVFG